MKPQTVPQFDDQEILDKTLEAARSWEDLAAAQAADAKTANDDAAQMTRDIKTMEDDFLAKLAAANNERDAKLRERDDAHQASAASAKKATSYRFMVEATCAAARIVPLAEPPTVTVLPGDKKVANGDPQTAAMAALTASGRQS